MPRGARIAPGAINFITRIYAKDIHQGQVYYHSTIDHPLRIMKSREEQSRARTGMCSRFDWSAHNFGIRSVLLIMAEPLTR